MAGIVSEVQPLCAKSGAGGAVLSLPFRSVERNRLASSVAELQPAPFGKFEILGLKGRLHDPARRVISAASWMRWQKTKTVEGMAMANRSVGRGSRFSIDAGINLTSAEWGWANTWSHAASFAVSSGDTPHSTHLSSTPACWKIFSACC